MVIGRHVSNTTRARVCAGESDVGGGSRRVATERWAVSWFRLADVGVSAQRCQASRFGVLHRSPASSCR